MVLTAFIFFSVMANAENCDQWLKKSNGKPGQANCEEECSSTVVDMGTFDCSVQCREYCKMSCAIDPFWENALKANPTPFKTLAGSEKEKVLNALDKLPKNFRPSSLRGIVRSQGFDPISRSNPASSSEEFIILFSAAFDSKVELGRVLLHEVAHHLIFNEWRKTFLSYKQNTGWDKLEGRSRSGKFVESDGRISPEEDLANNVEYFIFDPNKLNTTSPEIYKWIEKELAPQLKLQKGCN